MAIEASTAGLTINVAWALIEPEAIAIVVVPVPRVLASPAEFAVLLMVATFAAVELQWPDCVRSCVVPSVKVPVAVNCCVVPRGMVAVCGLIAMDTRAAGVTVSSVELLIPPEFAVMLAVPMPALCASPLLLMVAAEAVSEDQVAVLVRSCVLPSVNDPIAVNCCIVPSAMDGAVGVTAMETKAAEVTVIVVEPVIEPEVAEMLAVP